MTTETIVVAVIFGTLLVGCLCAFFYLCGYVKSMREEIELLELLDRLEVLNKEENK